MLVPYAYGTALSSLARRRSPTRAKLGTAHYEMHLRACRQVGAFEPDLRYTSDDLLILFELVRTAGAGALLPDLVIGSDAPGVVVRPFESGGIGREVFLLTPSQSKHQQFKQRRRPCRQLVAMPNRSGESAGQSSS